MLRLQEVADMLQVPAVTVRLWSDKGLLQVNRTPGGHRRFSLADVERFAHAHGMALAVTSANPAEPLRVLVVDDDPHWRELITRVIGQAAPQVQVETAANGFEAGRKSVDFAPDLVLLDIRMPGISGLEVCQRLQAAARSRCRIITISGYASEAEERALLEAGAECCLHKPLDFEYLLSLLNLPGCIKDEQLG